MAAAVRASRAQRGFISVTRRCSHSSTALKPQYDAIVIGAGHNGLIASAYLQKGGLKTAVLERRHVLGGAAVSEEIVPGMMPGLPESPTDWPKIGFSEQSVIINN
ncbi:pyridine nucleotide-disulfide oxidoreductase domain-containing protein 2 [Garra rufa]|uniref:pyridine nucleotide-disulfide oxidoreductase domain-containing protein 2 n=1 Tax=Garra rufa TaxID=137080 RepID=UPI003CCE9B9A